MSETFRARTIEAANHTALRVKDLERALHFYRDLIGLPVVREGERPGGLRSIWLPGLQLIEARDAQPSSTGTLDHLALGIENIEEVCARLDAVGFVAETPLQRRGRDEVGRDLTMAFYFDPEGNRVELLRYDD